MSDEFEECREVGVTERHKFWQPHIEAWEHSGITQSDYCRNNRLSIKVFGYWKRKLCSKRRGAVSFVPVSIKRQYPAHGDTSASLRLVIGNGYGIDIGDGFNPDTLRRLINTLDTPGQRV